MIPKTDFMQWCIANGKMNEADLDATLSKPQKNHTEVPPRMIF
jgi:hypothetical protein